MSTRIVSISDLRRQANDIINTIQETNEAVYITQHGRPAAVLVEYERYEQLLQDLEDLWDQLSVESAAAESTRPYVEFMAELGLHDTDLA